MHKNKVLAVLIFACIFVIAASAQEQPKTTIKHVPIKPTSAASGPKMFKNYCAACHGADARGDGPAASALKTAPTDLTALAKKNDGKYPAMKVTAILHGEAPVAAHGSKEMPIWGNLFWAMSGGHESEVQQRIANLNKYIEGLQQK